MIDFELLPATKQMRQMVRALAEGVFRPVSRYYDDHEHDKVQELYDVVERMGLKTFRQRQRRQAGCRRKENLRAQRLPGGKYGRAVLGRRRNHALLSRPRFRQCRY